VAANTDSPGVRILAAALRRAREQTGLTVRQVGNLIGTAHSQVSLWERAERIPDADDVIAFLRALGVPEPEHDQYLDLVQGAQNVLTADRAGMPGQLIGVIDCERRADRFTNWSPSIFPGLLQESSYARAILKAGQESDRDVEHLVTIRIGRRDVLTRRNPPPAHLTAYIGERALRQQIGGPAVMAAQLHFAECMADLDSVTIQIVPSATGYHPGQAGGFVLFDFPHSPGIVHAELLRAGAFMYDESDVDVYRDAISQIHNLAMNPADSRQLIVDIAKETESMS
jgi:transcriptional regulator with XRE-family HTH domain